MTYEMSFTPQEHDLLLIALGMAVALATEKGDRELARSILKLVGVAGGVVPEENAV